MMVGRTTGLKMIFQVYVYVLRKRFCHEMYPAEKMHVKVRIYN